MNLFVLDEDPEVAAQYHCDQHVGKMATEAAQLLSTAVSVLTEVYTTRPSADGRREIREYQRVGTLYRPTHRNHPCGVWLRESRGNATWAWELGLALLVECLHRGLSARAGTNRVLGEFPRYLSAFPPGRRTRFVTAINPVRYPTVDIQPDDPVATYRDYYRKGKMMFTKKGAAKWTRREKPAWI